MMHRTPMPVLPVLLLVACNSGVAGSGARNFDPFGQTAFRSHHNVRAASPYTPGGSTHANIFELTVTGNTDAPDVALIGVLRRQHEEGLNDGGDGYAIEGFAIHDATGDSERMIGVSGAVFLRGDGTVVDAIALRAASASQRPGSTGNIRNSYGLYVSPRVVGANRWAIYAEGPDPSRFGGPVYAPAFAVVGADGERRDPVALVDQLSARVRELESELAALRGR